MEDEIEYDVEQDIKALGDSVTVIDNMLAMDNLTDDDLDTLDRNVRHIEIMLAKDHIANSDKDLKVFEDAVARGREVL